MTRLTRTTTSRVTSLLYLVSLLALILLVMTMAGCARTAHAASPTIALIPAPTLAWQQDAASQSLIDRYQWGYYLSKDDRTVPTANQKLRKLPDVRCRESELAGTFNCTSPLPKITGWIRVVPIAPFLPGDGIGFASAPIFIPSTLTRR